MLQFDFRSVFAYESALCYTLIGLILGHPSGFYLNFATHKIWTFNHKYLWIRYWNRSICYLFFWGKGKGKEIPV